MSLVRENHSPLMNNLVRILEKMLTLTLACHSYKPLTLNIRTHHRLLRIPPRVCLQLLFYTDDIKTNELVKREKVQPLLTSQWYPRIHLDLLIFLQSGIIH